METPPADGAWNMACDAALMARAATRGEWVLRVYAWARPTLSFGRNQRARDAYDAAVLASHGPDVVRRPTGGRAILHDAEVTYSVTGAVPDGVSLRATYERINALVLHALRALGVDASVAARDGRYVVGPGSTAPCFDHPAPGEIVASGGKLVGSAQWRDDGALLQHGSILLTGDQALVSSLLRMPEPTPPPPATLAELLGRVPAFEEVREALFSAARTLEDGDATPLRADDAELVAGMRDQHPRFIDAAWTWRR